MIPFPVIMHEELAQRVPQTPLAEDDHAVQALRTNRAHETFRVGIGIRRLDDCGEPRPTRAAERALCLC